MTIRFKLTMAVIAVILVANSLLALVNIVSSERTWLDEVQSRVRLDLNFARVAYQIRIDDISRSLSVAALDDRLTAGVKGDDHAALEAWLVKLRATAAIDFLAVLDSSGKVIYRAQNAGQHGDSLADNPVVADAIASRKAASGSLVLPASVLAREGKDLAARARFSLLPTPAARPTDEQERSDGLAVVTAAPVLNDRGEVIAVLYGGNLLNRRSELVDSIKRQVFLTKSDDDEEIGTVTIFQGDLRVATNVVREDGSRAVGTRLSQAVYDEVIERGGTWVGPAFVVNDWYLSAYEPIRDPRQRIIGALYVGLLQSPFAHAQTAVVARFLITMTLATVTSLVLIFVLTMIVMRPIGKIVEMSRNVIAGNLSARVGIRPRGEMGVLCQAVDGMADALAEREAQLRQATRQQVTRAEKLASIGRLAAGVAHEINNPLTGVLTFAHLLRDKSNMEPQDVKDLDLIIHETTRAADIVRGLLDFSRERPTLMEELDLNDVVNRTVRLIANQQKFERIVIENVLQDNLPAVRGDMNQLQQALLNLTLNACAAMPQGGRLTIATSASDGKVVMKVSDTGCGIKEEDLDRIFEPFFTTQPIGKGTGLGLSVTYGIIQQHGGTLEVESTPGHGTTFTIALPLLELT